MTTVQAQPRTLEQAIEEGTMFPAIREAMTVLRQAKYDTLALAVRDILINQVRMRAKSGKANAKLRVEVDKLLDDIRLLDYRAEHTPNVKNVLAGLDGVSKTAEALRSSELMRSVQ